MNQYRIGKSYSSSRSVRCIGRASERDASVGSVGRSAEHDFISRRQENYTARARDVQTGIIIVCDVDHSVWHRRGSNAAEIVGLTPHTHTHTRPHRDTETAQWWHLLAGDPIIIIIIITITTAMFMVVSPWQGHCESSSGSFYECRLSANLTPKSIWLDLIQIKRLDLTS